MRIKVLDFQIDENNEAEMAEHGVTAEEAFEVLESNWSLRRNGGKDNESQPYIVVGVTYDGRLLYIPIQPINPESGLWRPATAFTPA